LGFPLGFPTKIPLLGLPSVSFSLLLSITNTYYPLISPYLYPPDRALSRMLRGGPEVVGMRWGLAQRAAVAPEIDHTGTGALLGAF